MHTRRPAIRRTGAPIHWPALLPEEAAKCWEDLRSWVEQLTERFAFDVRTIPPCWYRHNALVEALAALHDHEQACFEFAPSAAAGVEWLRSLQQIESLLRDWVARSGCDATQHRESSPAHRAVEPAGWSRHVADDVARRQAILDASSDGAE